MADPRKRLSENAPGEYFVDTTCIDCDACRQIAPQVFGEVAGSSFVRQQPDRPELRRAALQALISCPTGSIGTTGDDNPQAVFADFPQPVDGPVFFCGFNSSKSFGGNSYLVLHPEGNWLIDSPRFLSPLVRQIEARGGLSQIFLTHSDDVADADQFARHFGARRIIHQRELDSQPDAEMVLIGDDDFELAPGFRAIPTPGHTQGHSCLLVDNRFLFTGDHLYWDRDHERLTASRDHCWHSWDQQRRSLERLLHYPFEWVLPGHGQRVWLPAAQMRRELHRLVRDTAGDVTPR